MTAMTAEPMKALHQLGDAPGKMREGYQQLDLTGFNPEVTPGYTWHMTSYHCKIEMSIRHFFIYSYFSGFLINTIKPFGELE